MITAVVTGVGGQDGSYLAELLLAKKYRVVGVVKRRSSPGEYINLKNIINNKNFILLYGDITDQTFINRMLHDYKPEEYYALAAESHVGQSFVEPIKTFNVNAAAVINQLESIRQISPYTRFYNAATSELWGGIDCPKTGYDEKSLFHPRSPYAVAKLAAFSATRNYREAYGLFACSGISCNHSSIRRGVDFATRKISQGIANIKAGKEEFLRMGNLDAFRDESHAADITKGMHAMLQQENPEDYVLASGDGASIKDMAVYVSGLANLDFDKIYKKDERYMRPSDVPFLLGNPLKAFNKLNWKVTYSWKELLKEMYKNDLIEAEYNDKKGR